MRLAIPRWLALIPMAILCLVPLLFVLPPILQSSDPHVERLMKAALAQRSAHFAIADFDGDQQPDLAMVRVTKDAGVASEYSVDLKLSTGLRQPIGLLGPAGGLQISPQDVNGDQIADLVITAVLDEEYVAILLNDGKGNFRQVERSGYPDVGKHPASRWIAPQEPGGRELVSGPGRGPDGDSGVTEERGGPRPGGAAMTAWAVVPGSSSGSALSSAGRAPPAC